MSGKRVRQVAFYGKGGAGKSTTASNVAAALAEKGYIQSNGGGLRPKTRLHQQFTQGPGDPCSAGCFKGQRDGKVHA